VTKAEIIELLDGTHERFGSVVHHSIHGLIMLSALAIAVETEPGLPPLAHALLYGFELFVLAVFILEFLIRFWAAEHPWRYVFSFWGIIDLLSILPAVLLFTPEWEVFRTLRLIRLVRLLKLFRSSRPLERLMAAFSEVRGELAIFAVVSGLMLYVASVGIYLFEHTAQPEVFTSILTSLWWAVASFTTVGYGDMVPITAGGRIFTAFVLFLGLGIMAVPAAIVTTALLEAETNIRKRKQFKPPKPDDNNTETE
jgi:voltage-gated potassium channel